MRQGCLLGPLSISVLQKIIKLNKVKPFPPFFGLDVGAEGRKAGAGATFAASSSSFSSPSCLSSSSCFSISFFSSTLFAKYSLREEAQKLLGQNIVRHVRGRQMRCRLKNMLGGR